MPEPDRESSLRRPRRVVEHPNSGMQVEWFLFSGLDENVPVGMARDTIAPGSSSVLDVHGEHETWCVVSGAGQLCYEGRWERIAVGDVVYFQPFHSHVVHNDNDDPLVFLTIWWGP